MADSISAVLCRLARNSVSVQWRDGKAVFSAPTEPPGDVVALIDARKAEVSDFLRPDAVQRRLEAEADLLRTSCPPDLDVSDIYIDDDDVEIRVDVRWATGMRGLKAFIANGHGAEALRLGWPRSELFAVPPTWSRDDLRGVGLSIGDATVVEISSTEIKIKTASGAIQTFYRRPEPDLVLVYRSNYAALRRDLGHADAEPAAYDRVVALCQSTGLDLETSKQHAMAAMKESLRLGLAS